MCKTYTYHFNPLGGHKLLNHYTKLDKDGKGCYNINIVKIEFSNISLFPRREKMKFIFKLIMTVVAFCGFCKLFPRQAEWLKIQGEWLFLTPSHLTYIFPVLITIGVISVLFCLREKLKARC